MVVRNFRVLQLLQDQQGMATVTLDHANGAGVDGEDAIENQYTREQES